MKRKKLNYTHKHRMRMRIRIRIRQRVTYSDCMKCGTLGKCFKCGRVQVMKSFRQEHSFGHVSIELGAWASALSTLGVGDDFNNAANSVSVSSFGRCIICVRALCACSTISGDCSAKSFSSFSFVGFSLLPTFAATLSSSSYSSS